MSDALDQLFQKFPTLRVGVLGDVMLDTYMWGAVERISPEAPVPVVSLHKQEYRIGGAGNVALNIQSLGAKAYLLTVKGDDESADRLSKLFSEAGIDTTYTVRSPHRITTNKTRIIARNQQMMRLDAEVTADLKPAEEEILLSSLERFVQEVKPHILILEDYNKGVLTEAVIRSAISICREAGVLTAVDPKRKNFFTYKGVDLFKPNLKEVRDALNLLGAEATPAHLQAIHSELSHILHHRISFITLSEQGVYYQCHTGEARHIPSHLRNIADVSGAGDTVIATAALVYAATGDPDLMAEVANIAGGLVCEEVGTAAIRPDRLREECRALIFDAHRIS